MLEARVYYVGGRIHTIEANTLEMLKSKCVPFIADENVYAILVYKIEGLGYLKCSVLEDEDLL